MDEEKERARELVDEFRRALRAVPLAGTVMMIGSGWPKVIQVVRDVDGRREPVVSITLQTFATPVPAARQLPLAGVAVPFVESPAPQTSAPPAAQDGHTFATLQLTVVVVQDSIAAARAAAPGLGWREIAPNRSEAIVDAETLERLHARYPAGFSVRPFAPDASAGIVLEVHGEGETESDLSTNLAAALAPGGAPRVGTRRGDVVAELPRSTSESALAWAIGYLQAAKVAWSAREQPARRAKAVKP